MLNTLVPPPPMDIISENQQLVDRFQQLQCHESTPSAVVDTKPSIYFITDDYWDLDHRQKYSRFIDSLAQERQVVVLVPGLRSMVETGPQQHLQTAFLKTERAIIYGWDAWRQDELYRDFPHWLAALRLLHQIQMLLKDLERNQDNHLVSTLLSIRIQTLRDQCALCLQREFDETRYRYQLYKRMPKRTTSLFGTLEQVHSRHPNAVIIVLADTSVQNAISTNGVLACHLNTFLKEHRMTTLQWAH